VPEAETRSGGLLACGVGTGPATEEKHDPWLDPRRNTPMATYVMLTRLSPDAITEPDSIKALGRRVIDKLNIEIPEANWLSSYATLGPYDYLDLFEAPDNETAAKVSVIVRSFAHATTKIWPATNWERFLEVVGSASE
jgi:uncharacterized protein with GYD domain